MNIELWNKYKGFEWIKNYWIKTNKLNKINNSFEYK